MQFTYDRDYDFLKVQAYKLDVEIWFNKGEAESIVIAENTINANADCLYGISVTIDGKPFTLHQIMREAQDNYESIVAEAQEEDAAEAAMYAELSSPYLTGRI